MVGSTRIANNQTLTGTYALTSTLTEFEINAESEGTIDVLYTTGAAETNNYLNFKIEYSPDAGVTWIPETYDAIASGVNTLGELEHRIDGAGAGTTYKRQYMLPFCSKKIRIYVKETGVSANFGTVTVYLSVTSRNRQARNPSQVSVSVPGVATETTQQSVLAELQTINSFTPTLYDRVYLTYTGSNLTGVVFKLAGATVSTLTLSYTGSQLDSVIKS